MSISVDESANEGASTTKPSAQPPVGGARATGASVRARLTLGFGATVLVLAIAVGTTLYQTSANEARMTRITELRVPTALASADLTAQVFASLAALRGWLVTGDPAHKADRVAAWAEISRLRESMDGLSESWTNPDNVKRWQEAGSLLDEFRDVQARVEAIAHSPDERPARKIMLEEAAPRAALMGDRITRMIDRELALEATPERKALLGAMADVRGTLGLGMAAIRAYLLTGQLRFREGFAELWSKNEQRFADLKERSHLLTSEQRAAFEVFARTRGEFAPLPPKMFEIRASDKWNMAQYMLVTEAVPRASRILDQLVGVAGNDGRRTGGMKDDQQELLKAEAISAADDVARLQMTEWFFLAFGLGLAAIVGWLTARSIARPLITLNDATRTMAGGDLRGKVSEDGPKEIALLGQSFNAMGTAMEGVARKIGDVSGNISTSLEEISAAVNSQSAGAAEQATAVNQTTSTLDEIRATSGQMLERAEALSTIAERTREEGERGLAVIEQAVESMQSIRDKVEAIAGTNLALSDQSKQIGEITAAVNNVAQQSKMLALNASIEAAKAGEAGKGFAVVAGQIGRLAEQSEESTVQVQKILEDIQHATDRAVMATEEGTKEVDKGVALVQQTGEVMASLNTVIHDSGAASQQITVAVRQEAAGIDQIAAAMGEINKVTAQFVTASEQTKEATQNMGVLVDELAASVAVYKV